MFVPKYTESIVTNTPSDKVLTNLEHVTLSGKRTVEKQDGHLFTGKVKGNDFDLLRIVNKPENFMPRTEGFVETNGEGAVVFLKYTLQFSSKMFVVFWSLTSLFFALFLWFVEINLTLGLLSMLGLLVNLGITHINFRRKVKEIRTVLTEVINQ